MMSYFRKRGGSMSGFGDDSNPMYDIFDAFSTNPDDSAAAKGRLVEAAATATPAPAKKSFFDVFVETLTKPAAAPAPTTVIQQAPSSGVSTTTLLVAGGAAVLLIAVLASRN